MKPAVRGPVRPNITQRSSLLRWTLQVGGCSIRRSRQLNLYSAIISIKSSVLLLLALSFAGVFGGMRSSSIKVFILGDGINFDGAYCFPV